MKQQVTVLTGNRWSRNEYAFLFPLRRFRQVLLDHKIDIQVQPRFDPRERDTDVLILTSHWARDWNLWASQESVPGIVQEIQAFKRCVPIIIWADVGDSTGSTHFPVLDSVSLYLKPAVLKDRKAYTGSYYGCRIFSDYYHRFFDVRDDNPGEDHLRLPATPSQIHKIAVGWNQSFANYSYFGSVYDQCVRRLPLLPTIRLGSLTTPGTDRPIRTHARFATDYSRPTVAYQRQRIKEIASMLVEEGRICRWRFFLELRRSQVVLSPFGWGEICYRDFEAMWAGAALLKPDMSHLSTWPPIYQRDFTYRSFPWDLADLPQRIKEVVATPDKSRAVAENAQSVLETHVLSRSSAERFADRVTSLIERAQDNTREE